MLMRIREQKGWIRGIFVVLVLVFAGSFVIGGVGSGNNFSLSDIIGNNSGGSSGTTSTPTSSDVTKLQKQLKTSPRSAILWSQLADAYTSANNTDLAIAAQEKAVKYAPTSVAQMRSLATLYQTKASALNTEAQTLYTQAYTLQQQSPDSSPFNLSSGTLGAAVEDPFTKSQSNQYSVQISSLESRSQALQTQAISWDNKALTQYKTIVNRHVDDAQSWLNYATVAEQVGNSAAALKGYKQFVRLVPADPVTPQVKSHIKSLEKSSKTSTTTTGGTSTTSTSTTSTTSTTG
jgi:tetratricopeptide (TPR) repeat protein